MQSKLADIIYSAVIGDAAGYTFSGMKKKHIKAVFGDITDYFDPSPGLVKKMHKWKKAGFYSSISQFMFLVASCIDNETFKSDRFIKFLTTLPEVQNSRYSFFRNPGSAEKQLISGFMHEASDIHHTYYSSRILPVSIPLLMVKNINCRIISNIKLVSLFTRNPSNLACSVFLINLLDMLMAKSENQIIDAILRSSELSLKQLIDNQRDIFDSGFNPDSVISEGEFLITLIEDITRFHDIEKYSINICSKTEKKIKKPVPGPNTDIPETLLAYSIFIVNSCSEPENVYRISAAEGGEASALTSLSASMACAFYGRNIPETFERGLVNKKMILSVMNYISGEKKLDHIKQHLFESEPGLTLKEIEEYESRNKNRPEQKDKFRKKPGKDPVSELSRHVVESWTKPDKAKWRKERKKHKTENI